MHRRHPPVAATIAPLPHPHPTPSRPAAVWKQAGKACEGAAGWARRCAACGCGRNAGCACLAAGPACASPAALCGRPQPPSASSPPHAALLRPSAEEERQGGDLLLLLRPHLQRRVDAGAAPKVKALQGVISPPEAAQRGSGAALRQTTQLAVRRPASSCRAARPLLASLAMPSTRPAPHPPHAPRLGARSARNATASSTPRRACRCTPTRSTSSPSTRERPPGGAGGLSTAAL